MLSARELESARLFPTALAIVGVTKGQGSARARFVRLGAHELALAARGVVHVAAGANSEPLLAELRLRERSFPAHAQVALTSAARAAAAADVAKAKPFLAHNANHCARQVSAAFDPADVAWVKRVVRGEHQLRGGGDERRFRAALAGFRAAKRGGVHPLAIGDVLDDPSFWAGQGDAPAVVISHLCGKDTGIDGNNDACVSWRCAS